ncbi:hypothetical protein PIIN_08043 [Serendipita indica DSM 11827]|uniref:F-box domain-containing protein n=1 Tax=Serendipita indica (strain DSM 11827) TaxID=1109443 RepID=G4TRZ6_SERID|nr:hypothetical protein PIIN_08043 [Serendipita indica DSM 11827]
MTILECKGRHQPIIHKRSLYPAWETERLNVFSPGFQPKLHNYDREPWPSRWLTESWDSLVSLIIEPSSLRDPIPLVSRAPNLRLLSCSFHGRYMEEKEVNALLLHPQLERLTHLSLHLGQRQLSVPMVKLTLPSLRFLQLDFKWSLLDPARITQEPELIPWTLPALSTLSLHGYVNERVFSLLEPFLFRHSSTIVNVLCALGSTRQYSILRYFNKLQMYVISTAWVMTSRYEDDIVPSSHQMQYQPLTLLLMDPHLPSHQDVNWLKPAPKSFVEKIISVSRYRVTRVMLDRPWNHIRSDIETRGEFAADFRFKLMVFLTEFQELDVAVVDLHGVEMPRNMENWLDAH